MAIDNALNIGAVMSENKPRFGFRTSALSNAKPADPESLFNAIKNRAPSVKALWSHQADVLRAYSKGHVRNSDVALQLPTGSGKTLVGLLIAEYRRLTQDERVLYLCPTRQLVHQVKSQAEAYGIASAACLAKEYEGLQAYKESKLIAISTYSSLFNVNPKFDDAQTIILDDAHSAEDFIARMWTVEIERRELPALYKAILLLFQSKLRKDLVSSFLADGPPPDVMAEVEMVPHPFLLEYEQPLVDLLAEHLVGNEQRYPFGKIRHAIKACSLFVSWGGILIRPFVPPTMSHRPFAGAVQRVYMSATLGSAGELERLAGIPKIQRIPAPDGWEGGASGRRLFLMPTISLNESDAIKVAVSAAVVAGRTLVLTPRATVADALAKQLDAAGLKLLGPKDIEDSLESFRVSKNAALILANRYDGIDLPGDDCRLLALCGLPAGSNLIERFLLTRMSAGALLRDRMRTRITQAVGRCCRGATDYAAVILVGQKLVDFCAKRDVRGGLHPELQAELEFGLENSQSLPAEGFAELLQLFLKRGEEWAAAEADIVARRGGKAKKVEDLSIKLGMVASSEVEFAYSLWNGDFAAARSKARAVSDALGGVELAPYRALWYYFEGIAAWYEGVASDKVPPREAAIAKFIMASRCSRFVGWFSQLATLLDIPADQESIEAVDCAVAEKSVKWLNDAGLHGKEFERRLTKTLENLGNTEATQFAMGLEELGRILGAASSRPTEQTAPDGAWIFSPKHAVVFEAKSNEKPKEDLSFATVRQAGVHEKWARDNLNLDSDPSIDVVIVSPRKTVSADARGLAGELNYMDVEDIKELANDAFSAMRVARSQIQETSDENAVEIVYKAMSDANCNGGKLVQRLTRRKVAKM